MKFLKIFSALLGQDHYTRQSIGPSRAFIFVQRFISSQMHQNCPSSIVSMTFSWSLNKRAHHDGVGPLSVPRVTHFKPHWGALREEIESQTSIIMIMLLHFSFSILFQCTKRQYEQYKKTKRIQISWESKTCSPHLLLTRPVYV